MFPPKRAQPLAEVAGIENEEARKNWRNACCDEVEAPLMIHGKPYADFVGVLSAIRGAK